MIGPNYFEVSLESSVCKAIAKLLGSSTDLNVFDQLRCMYKQGDRHMLPSQKERYHSLARYFRKKISAKKRSLDLQIAQVSPNNAMYSEYAKDIKLCLKLVCNFH